MKKVSFFLSLALLSSSAIFADTNPTAQLETNTPDFEGALSINEVAPLPPAPAPAAKPSAANNAANMPAPVVPDHAMQNVTNETVDVAQPPTAENSTTNTTEDDANALTIIEAVGNTSSPETNNQPVATANTNQQIAAVNTPSQTATPTINNEQGATVNSQTQDSSLSQNGLQDNIPAEAAPSNTYQINANNQPTNNVPTSAAQENVPAASDSPAPPSNPDFIPPGQD